MSISVVMLGDFAPTRRYADVARSDPSGLLGDVRGIVEAADFSFVNLECPLTDRPASLAKSGPALRGPSEAARALRPFSVAGLANNHILDCGVSGLRDTVGALTENGVPYTGITESKGEPLAPFVKEVRGVRIGILAVAELEFNRDPVTGIGAQIFDVVEVSRAILATRSQLDRLVVTIHGGVEYEPLPRPALRRACQLFVELGADAVVCHHPHVVGGWERYRGRPILYSLGNCLFDSDRGYAPAGWEIGMIAELRFSGDDQQPSVEFQFVENRLKIGGMRLIDAAGQLRLRQEVEELSAFLGHADYESIWDSRTQSVGAALAFQTFSPLMFRGLPRLARMLGFMGPASGASRLAQRLNAVRCPSHSELLARSLEAEFARRDGSIK